MYNSTSIGKTPYPIYYFLLKTFIISLFVFLFFVFLLVPFYGFTQDVDDNKSCYECHGEEDLVGEIDGEEVSMFINSNHYQNSVHADFYCIDCHQDIEELPHDFELEKVDCGNCHFDMADDLSESVHNLDIGPDCTSCHGEAHSILLSDNEGSPVHRSNIIRQCSTCHNPDWQATNDQEAETMGESSPSYMESVHGKAWLEGNTGAANCVDCHGAHKILAAENPESLVNHVNTPETCGQCHEDINQSYFNSIHAESMHEGSPDAASCISCHGEHTILQTDDANAQTARTHIYDMCGKCHFDVALMDKYGIASAEQETLFKGSVHAEEVFSGNEDAPTCISCHGHHEVLALRNPESPTNFTNVASTCGECHSNIEQQYNESVHGESAQQGHKDAPVCTDCHGEHAILRTEDQRSPVSHFNVSQNTCGRCHASIVINDKYGISATKVDNFFASYHGLALQHGSKTVANCASCHGDHQILPADDPRSTVSPNRLVETCGSCHPGISTNVLAAPIHSEITLRSDLIAAWVPRIYLLLIVVVIGSMIMHNGVILWALLKVRFRREESSPNYKRFTAFEIWMHILLSISFILLVITGFALVNPNSWWVTLLSYMYMDETVRSLLHRIAGVILIITSFAYAFYMLGSRRGRSEFWAFWPKWDDVKHPWQHLAYYMGKRKEPPKFDRYDYTEKLEFWALVWGVIIMAVTGLMLWFPILALQYLPKCAIDMAELVHYYEAVLATLAIIIWHFFFVIFHPEQYPMSTTWLTGKMTLEQLKHHHPKEYERVVNDPKLYEQLVNNAKEEEK